MEPRTPIAERRRASSPGRSTVSATLVGRLATALILFAQVAQAQAAATTSRDAEESGEKRELSLPELATFALPHVVKVTVESGSGSGFFLDENLIITSLHVVRGMEQISFKSDSWTGTAVAAVAWSDEDDLAILRVFPSAKKMGLKLASPPYRVGTRVVAVSSPLGLENSFSDGVISAVRTKPRTVLQFTAPISPGSSGAPLLDVGGDVVGIVASTLTALSGGRTYGQNLNFAVPASAIEELVHHSSTTPLGEFARTTLSEQDRSWLVAERAIPSIERSLPDELGSRVAIGLAASIRRAVKERDQNELRRLLERRVALRNARGQLMELVSTLESFPQSGTALSKTAIAAWEEFSVNPDEKSASKLNKTLGRCRDFLSERLQSSTIEAFPEAFAGFTFGASQSGVFSYCYPGYARGDQPGLSELQCLKLPVPPPFAALRRQFDGLFGVS